MIPHMEIQEYRFGNIVIDGTAYTSDVIIGSGRVRDGWLRVEGHNLHREDLAEVLDQHPATLIIGTGSHGKMRVSRDLLKELEEMGITVHVLPTSDAVALYNQHRGDDGVAAGLHLTC
jgi:hypothetical protein